LNFETTQEHEKTCLNCKKWHIVSILLKKSNLNWKSRLDLLRNRTETIKDENTLEQAHSRQKPSLINIPYILAYKSIRI
jgi:hypothetical protein